MVETMSYHGKQYLRHVRLDIVEYFDQDELRDLTFDLGVNWDDLPGDTISAKARSLTLFMAHRGRLDELVGLLKEERPNVDWPDIPSPQKQIEDAQKALETEAELEKILQDYISEIKNLLLEYNLRHPEKEDAKQIARSHTVLALRKLDEERNQRLIEFLRELKLIGQQPDIINLDRVELRNCELSGIDLSYVDLNWSDFRGSLLNKSNIRGGNLNKALLSNADLERADLRNANLDEAFLSNCYLRWAILHEVSLYRADLYKADLLGADLLGADLREANLVDSILTDALLSEADLDEKYLMFARTSNISLKPANLSKARYSENTKWPDGFDPIARGLILDE